jgi:hypothetical protein
MNAKNRCILLRANKNGRRVQSYQNSCASITNHVLLFVCNFFGLITENSAKIKMHKIFLDLCVLPVLLRSESEASLEINRRKI